jgi:hypothetical protein
MDGIDIEDSKGTYLGFGMLKSSLSLQTKGHSYRQIGLLCLLLCAANTYSFLNKYPFQSVLRIRTLFAGSRSGIFTSRSGSSFGV